MRRILLIILVFSISTLGFAIPTAAAQPPQIKVSPLAPLDGETVQGQTTLRSYVAGIPPDGYLMFWAVDHGQWNRMQPDANNPDIATATVDVSNWHWQSSGTYTLQFIALLRNNWQPVEQDITIRVGEPSAQPLAKAPQQLLRAAPDGLFVDTENDAIQHASEWVRSHPQDAASMDYLVSQPIAAWFGNWNGDHVEADVNRYVGRATSANQIPMLVAYNIPARDCGSYSAGGADSAQGYTEWLDAFAQGIGKRQAMVILEPDALAGMDCLPSFGRSTRLSLLSQAVHTLKTTTDAKVYIDAGNPNWHSAAAMADRLSQSNVSEADGFSLNVSNFFSTADSIAYGATIAHRIDNKHFVIDTSRNGNGPAADYAWCNPLGRAVGQSPTLATGDPLVDAFLWIKGPGGSDGACGTNLDGTTAPAAGVWWPQYALSLLRNAGH